MKAKSRLLKFSKEVILYLLNAQPFVRRYDGSQMRMDHLIIEKESTFGQNCYLFQLIVWSPGVSEGTLT